MVLDHVDQLARRLAPEVLELLLRVVALDRRDDLLLDRLHVRRRPHRHHPRGHREVDHAERALVVDDLDAPDLPHDLAPLLSLPLAEESGQGQG